ncbi:DUF2723 domain-containing protein [bacterium]|nr:DUF2723 domain-containing protein [bacterium]MBU1599809.1 DUF2723 domain-containing protein [bacterium]
MKKGKVFARWLPSNEPILEPFGKIDYLCGLLVLFVSFGVYLATLMPTVGLYDAGDMTAASWVLGIPHPPGYPLYCLVGKFWMTFIPIGNLAYRLNMFSAFCASLAVMTTYFITLKLTSSQSAIHDWKFAIPPVVASLCLAFSYTFWQQATFAGQYLPNITFALLLIFLLLKWAEARSNKSKTQSPDYPNIYLYLFSFITGLSLAHHRQILFLMPGSFFFILIVSWKYRAKGERLKIKSKKSLLSTLNSKLLTLLKLPYTLHLKPSTLLVMMLLFILPLSLYIYLPISASSNPPINWGDPKTLSRFLEMIAGERYSFLFTDLSWKEVVLKAATQTYSLFLSQFGAYPLLFGLAGLVVMATRNGLSFFLLAITFLTDILISVHYGHPSIELYYMIPFAIGSLWIGLGAWGIIRVLAKAKLQFLSLFFLILPLLPAFSNYKANDRSRYYFEYDYTLNILRPLRERAVVILTGSDPHVFNTWYFHYAEKVREDVVLVEPHNFHLEWYAECFKKRHPDVPFDLYPVKKAILSFDEVRWQRLEDLVKKNLPQRPIYIFPEANRLNEYEFVPEGIFSRIVNKEIPPEELLDILNENRMGLIKHRGIFEKITPIDSCAQVSIVNHSVSYFNRGRLYFNLGKWANAESEIKEALKINPPYLQAHYLLACIYRGTERIDEAIREYREILKLDPKHIEALNDLGYIYYTQGRLEEANRQFKTVLEIDPNNIYAKQMLEKILDKQKLAMVK